jgi:hypothetical protein
MDINWDGITQSGALSEKATNARNAIADAAKSYNWPTVFKLISEDKDFVNSSRLGGTSLYAPLHQAAHAGASAEIVQRFIELGAWRTLLNSRGERAVDVAERMGHRHLLKLLEPVLKHHVPIGVLLKIQSNFHAIIRGRIDQDFPNHELRLPELEPLLELDQPHMWFAVPGMCGGFSYRLQSTGVDAKLVVESWSRVVDGSGQRHEITSKHSRLVEEGFV